MAQREPVLAAAAAIGDVDKMRGALEAGAPGTTLPSPGAQSAPSGRSGSWRGHTAHSVPIPHCGPID